MDEEGRLEVALDESSMRYTTIVGNIIQLQAVWSGRSWRSTQGTIRKKISRSVARSVKLK